MPADRDLPGFIVKLFEIFNNNSAYKDLCGWGDDGTTIIIYNITEFTRFVIPNHFKHNNFPSFVRQLNMYDFHKTTQDPNHGEFKHDHFIRGRPDLLSYIRRKATGAKSAPSSQAAKVIESKAASLKSIQIKNTLAARVGGTMTASSSSNNLSLVPPEAALKHNVGHSVLGLETPTTTTDDLLVFESEESPTNIYFPDKISNEDDLFEPIDLEFGQGASYDISKSTSSALAMQLPDTDINITDSLASKLLNNNCDDTSPSVFHQLTTSPVGVIVTSESESLLKELTYQKLMREHFEKRLNALENNSQKIIAENQNLRKFAVESCNRQLVMQSKMDKVLKTLFNVFISKAIGNPAMLGVGATLPPFTPRTMNQMISDVSDSIFQKPPGSATSTTSDASAAMLAERSFSLTPPEMNRSSGQPLAKSHSLDVNFNDVCSYLQVENPFSRSNSISYGNGGTELVRKHSLDIDTLSSNNNNNNNGSLGLELSRGSRSDSFEAAAYAISNPPPQLRAQHSLTGYQLLDGSISSSSAGGAPLSRMMTIFPGGNIDAGGGIGFLKKEPSPHPENGAPPPAEQRGADTSARGKRKREKDAADADDATLKTASIVDAINANDFHFMDQFTKSQYATLSRIDSLKSTIATFFAPLSAPNGTNADGNGNQAAATAATTTATAATTTATTSASPSSEKRRSERIKH